MSEDELDDLSDWLDEREAWMDDFAARYPFRFHVVSWPIFSPDQSWPPWDYEDRRRTELLPEVVEFLDQHGGLYERDIGSVPYIGFTSERDAILFKLTYVVVPGLREPQATSTS